MTQSIFIMHVTLYKFEAICEIPANQREILNIEKGAKLQKNNITYIWVYLSDCNSHYQNTLTT